MTNVRTAERILIFRLSSLGDIVLASTALTHLKSLGSRASIDWVIASEYTDLLKGDPRLNQLWQFDRKIGLKGWLKFCRDLFERDYDLVLDLHSSLRTKIARIFFKLWAIQNPRPTSDKLKTSWKAVPKQRFRLLGYFWFKNLWPEAWRPRSWIRRINRLLGNEISATPDLSFHAQNTAPIKPHLGDKKYYCVMPSSIWKTKSWSVENFFKAIQSAQSTNLLPVILGTNQDRSSVELAQKLEASRIPHFSGVGKWNLAEVATVLAGAEFYLGNDTGLGHLAEAVGRPSIVIFGPTVPQMGFSPWRPESHAIGVPLWCRPCSKDGRACHRLGNKRHSCLSTLSPELVASLVLRQSKRSFEPAPPKARRESDEKRV